MCATEKGSSVLVSSVYSNLSVNMSFLVPVCMPMRTRPSLRTLGSETYDMVRVCNPTNGTRHAVTKPVLNIESDVAVR